MPAPWKPLRGPAACCCILSLTIGGWEEEVVVEVEVVAPSPEKGPLPRGRVVDAAKSIAVKPIKPMYMIDKSGCSLENLFNSVFKPILTSSSYN